MTNSSQPPHVVMLGTFGFRPKATLRARALAIAQALGSRGWSTMIGTTPWDLPADAGRFWTEAGIPLRNTRTVHPALWPLAVREMVSWVPANEPTIVHVFKPKGFGDLAGRWLRRRHPLVVDMDDWEGDGGWNDTGLYGPLQRRVFQWQEQTLPPRADAVTAASRTLERYALDLGGPRDRVFYVPNGLTGQRLDELTPDPAMVATLRATTISGPGPWVLLYTRFVEFDPVDLVRFLVRVRQELPSAGLVIAGASADGGPEETLRRAAAAAGVADALTLLGWTDPLQIGSIAQICDVAIHPFEDTLLNRAKCSVKLLELMATGTPVVTTRVGENAEAIRHGETGLLVPAGDWDAMAMEVIGLLQDAPRRRAIGSAARAFIEQERRWDRLIDDVLAAYQEAYAARCR